MPASRRKCRLSSLNRYINKHTINPAANPNNAPLAPVIIMTQKFIPMANIQGTGASIIFLVLLLPNCSLVQSDIEVKLRND